MTDAFQGEQVAKPRFDERFRGYVTAGDWKFEPETENDDLEIPESEIQAGYIYVDLPVSNAPEAISVLVEADWATEDDLRIMAAGKEMLAALKAADQFIRNGIEFGYIRMPDPTTPDTAHQTPGIVSAAIARAEPTR